MDGGVPLSGLGVRILFIIRSPFFGKEVAVKSRIHPICAPILTLVLVLLGSFRPVPVSALGVTFTVDTFFDAPDIHPGDGICDDGLNECSLRASIQEAYGISSSGNPVTINFAPALSGPIILNLGPLDWAASYVTLDGGNFFGVSGAGLLAGQSIFRISGSHNTLSRLTILNSPWDGVQMGDFSGWGGGNYNTVTNSYILGSGADGVWVHGSSNGGGQYNSVMNSTLGFMDSDQTACSPGEGNGGEGIYLDGLAYATTITSNTIGCSGNNGISIDGASGSPTGTVIQDNYIGLNWAGAMPNDGQGVREQQGVNTRLISNVISGNVQNGVQLLNSTGATLHNNYIGTDIVGTAALPNGGNGVLVTIGATNNTVGGYSSGGNRNVISGNSACGVSLQAGATGNLVDYNLIGLDVTGMSAIPNGQAGVCVSNAGYNNIGSSAAGVSQYISGNTHEGILIEASSNTFIGPTNRIGVAMNDSTPRGNGWQGIMLKGASSTLVYPSILSNNGYAGVALVGNAATGNRIAFMVARANGGLPIDLGDDGTTPNGAHTPPGPNDWLAYPVITSAGGSPVALHGTVCALCTVLVYAAVGNPAANGGGGAYINETVSDASGIWSFTLPPGLNRDQVSLVAFKPLAGLAGNTSEMSPVNVLKQYLPLIRR